MHHGIVGDLAESAGATERQAALYIERTLAARTDIPRTSDPDQEVPQWIY